MKLSKVVTKILPIVVLLSAFTINAQENENLLNNSAIAEEVNYTLDFPIMGSQTTDYNQVISHPGAGFIKVKFSQIDLPLGSYIVVSNLSGSESYRYNADDASIREAFSTANLNNSFSAMSISADEVNISVFVPEEAQWQYNHGVKITSYYAGFSDQELELKQLIDTQPTDGTESTCGINERRDAVCYQDTYPTEYERSRPVAHLIMEKPSGLFVCTAWRVGPDNHMVTNNHCFNSSAVAKKTEVWFNYQHLGCGDFGNQKAKRNGIKVIGDRVLKSDNFLDYTLFSINGFDKIKQFGHYGLDINPQVKGQRIYIPQHGSGKPKELAITSDQNSSGFCEVDQVKTAGRGNDTDAGYKCDTIGGSSGSPVLSAKSNKVIALHHYGNSTNCTSTLNRGVRMELIWPQVSSHFSGVVPVGDGGISPNLPPVANIQAQCDLLQCTFDSASSSDSDGSIASVAWQFGDGATSQNPLNIHNYASSGEYQVTLVVTDNEGSQDSAVTTVTVRDGNQNQAPIARFSFASNNLEVSFTDASTDDSGVTSHGWIFGDGQVSAKANPKHVYSQAGTYTVKLTVTDQQGLSHFKQQTLTVIDGTNPGCSGVSGWDTAITYQIGDKVTRDGNQYVATYWSRQADPLVFSNVWKKEASCK